MPMRNGYAVYQNSAVNTASPGELTLMLYEGMIKFVNIAMAAIDEKDYEKANTNIKKTEAIIDELQSTLNHKYPVAKDFDNIYNYLRDRLLQANMKKDNTILEECLEHMRTLRDTWKEVIRRTKNGATVARRGA